MVARVAGCPPTEEVPVHVQRLRGHRPWPLRLAARPDVRAWRYSPTFAVAVGNS